MNFSDDLQTLTSLIYFAHTPNVATVTSTKQTTIKQGARYFLVKVFQQSTSSYKHIPKS
jgi:hypothetical protein